MPVTKRSDGINVDILTEAVMAAFSGVTVLGSSRAVVRNNTLPKNRIDGGALQGGDTIRVPYFDNLGELDDVTEGDGLTPVKLTMDSETATVQQAGKMVEITHWARLRQQYADPYVEAARQFRVMAERKFDTALISAASTSLPSSNVLDVYSATTPRLLDWDLMVDGTMLFGDEQSGIELMIVHSKVLGDLKKLKDGNGRPLLEMRPTPDGVALSFMGIPIRVSDKEAPSNDTPKKYKTRIYKRGALALWLNEEPVILEDVDISKNSEMTAIHVYFVAHRYQRLPDTTRAGVVELIHN